MSKVRTKAMETAINLAVQLRRKVVDIRLDRVPENVLLDKTSDLIATLEKLQEATEVLEVTNEPST